MQFQSNSHVTRVRWKWIFGIPFIVYGVYAVVKRWILWYWDDDWQVYDLMTEPASIVLGYWLIKEAIIGTIERLQYGAVEVQITPIPLCCGLTCTMIVIIPSGARLGDMLKVNLLCQLAVPSSDDVSYFELWQKTETCLLTPDLRSNNGMIAQVSITLPNGNQHKNSSPNNYQTLRLFLTIDGKLLNREFQLPWTTHSLHKP